MDCNCNNRYDARRNRYTGRPVNRRQTASFHVPVQESMSRGSASNDRAPSHIDHFTAAMAYVPWQKWNETYELCRGLQAGTIFPELDKPFLCRRCGR